jgi:hypothetical protein
VRVPEAAPGNKRQPESFACGPELASQKVFRIEQRLVPSSENQTRVAVLLLLTVSSGTGRLYASSLVIT